MEEENSLRNKVRSWIKLESPDPLKPLCTRWENSKRITSQNSYSQVLTEPGDGLLSSRWLQCTNHTLPWFQLQLAQTVVPLQELRIYDACAPRHSLKLFHLASIADPFRCINTHATQTKLIQPLNVKTVILSGGDPSLLSNPGGSRTDGRPIFWSALLTTSFIAKCLGKRPTLHLQYKPCKPLLPIRPPLRQEWGIQTSAPTLRAMATLKLSESSSVPSDKTDKGLSQAPLSFCDVASNLPLDTWSTSRNKSSQFLLTIIRSQAFWRLWCKWIDWLTNSQVLINLTVLLLCEIYLGRMTYWSLSTHWKYWWIRWNR